MGVGLQENEQHYMRVKHHLCTEAPVRHGSRTAYKVGKLIHNSRRRRTTKEVKIQNTTDDSIHQTLVSVLHIHAIAVEEQHPVCKSTTSHVHVKWVCTVQGNVNVPAPDVSCPQSVIPARP